MDQTLSNVCNAIKMFDAEEAHRYACNGDLEGATEELLRQISTKPMEWEEEIEELESEVSRYKRMYGKLHNVVKSVA